VTKLHDASNRRFAQLLAMTCTCVSAC